MYQDFQDLPVWQKAMQIALSVFKITENLPRKEDYGLTSQIRRSSLSISDNIAEGFGRHHKADKINFYIYSRGSANETKNQLIYGNKVGYFDTTEANNLINSCNEVIESLNRLMKALRSQP
ncbi:S23 ribosomal protein [Pseudopedobacter saltans DSM 12145]|uniref:S23 ribosomal protein n=1 Tax=Pseudopedobacter saltans (strain ATCC 51119 / DSM 12145 / JCM 21818 / CCUG 39354 / LMG 10337 / NBRC 100064 / NCIMB 13643) TaxID=762903 RepID=F0SD76_PSESL|nr:four helix bundle protein [Pseudopedobacter saltans]ADY52862.1 S23 ribosomal protein [Pseudopedobacter saltans DSM 12145]